MQSVKSSISLIDADEVRCCVNIIVALVSIDSFAMLQGIVAYRGYSVEELCEHSNFLDVAHLLLTVRNTIFY